MPHSDIRTCETCKKEYEHEPLLVFGRDFASNVTNCPPCSEAQEEAEKRSALAKIAGEKWRKSVPKNYRNTDLEHANFKKVYAHYNSALQWFIGSDLGQGERKPFLGLVGDSGKCKTRIISQVAKKFIQRGENIRWVNSADWQWDVQHLHDNYERIAATERIKSACRASVLVFDDIGSLKATEAVCERFYALLETRSNLSLTTLWTSNETVAEMLVGKNITPKARTRCTSRLAGYSNIIEL